MAPTLGDHFIVICSVTRPAMFYELPYEETTQEGTEGGLWNRCQKTEPSH